VKQLQFFCSFPIILAGTEHKSAVSDVVICVVNFYCVWHSEATDHNGHMAQPDTMCNLFCGVIGDVKQCDVWYVQDDTSDDADEDFSPLKLSPTRTTPSTTWVCFSGRSVVCQFSLLDWMIDHHSAQRVTIRHVSGAASIPPPKWPILCQVGR